MGNKAGKIWGETELILANNALEFHRIDFKEGGVCSKHLHEWKWNGFYCMTDGVAFELYWANFSHHDIVRESVGHLKDTDGKVVRLDKNKKK